MNDVQPQALLDQPVYDSEHHKVGKVKQLYLDENTQQPTWAAVETGGLFSHKESMLPLKAAHMEDDGLVVDLPADAIKEAPTVDADAELTTRDQETLLNFYNAVFLAERGQSHGSRQTGQRTDQPDNQADSSYDRNDDTAEADTPEGRRNGADASGPSTDTAMTRSEEQLQVDKEQREHARLRLKKYIVTEHQTVNMPLQKEKLRVEREPITDENRDAAMDGPRLSEEAHDIVLREELPRVHKETVPMERVRMTKDTVEHNFQEDHPIRKEQIRTEKIDPAETAND